MKTCAQCGKLFGKNRRRFCCVWCKSKWHHKHRKITKPHAKECVICGKSFATKHGRSQSCANYKCRAQLVSRNYDQRAREILNKGKKSCSKCHQVKPLSKFASKGGDPERFHSWCRECEFQYINKENRRYYIKQYNKKKYKDVCHRLNASISSRLRIVLPRNRHWRRNLKLLDYSARELKEHLEKQFQGGMSWNNYGEWHIDHIIPLSAFNFDSPAHIDFRRCWALNNLQPLWAKENMQKKDKLTIEFQPALKLDCGGTFSKPLSGKAD